ncbi:MAG: hypothetical protein HOV80_18640 [Polyangiaceae bacterium]|nr:hypothetical protein [Polyangiaceae bacterium]
MSFFARALLVTLGAALCSCAEPSGQSCELNSDCLQGTCVDGTCQRECREADVDCPKGYLCNARGVCEYGGDGGAGPAGPGGTSSTGEGGNGTTSTMSTTSTMNTTGPGPSSTSSGMTTDAADLTLCNADGDCESGICRLMTPSGPKRCTHACSSNSQCPSGLRCENVNGSDVCVQSDVGRSCTSAGQCNFACLTPLDYCVSECSSGADCPAGFGCMPVGNPSTDVCVRLSADCAADSSQCVAPSACDTSPNLVVSSCTIACDSAADCPQRALPFAPWTCDGVCRRPADVYGPLPGGYEPAQWACNASFQVVNVCNDGLHIDFDAFSIPSAPGVSCASPTTTDGLAGDACLDSCRLQGACEYGYGCVGLGDLGGTRIGLCLPAGPGEVGASCSTNGNCAFALCQNGTCSRDCSKDGVCPEGSQCVAQGGPNIEGQAYRICQ